MIRQKIACWNRLSPIRIPGLYPDLESALKVIDYPCTLIVDRLTPTRIVGGNYSHITIEGDIEVDKFVSDSLIEFENCIAPTLALTVKINTVVDRSRMNETGPVHVSGPKVLNGFVYTNSRGKITGGCSGTLHNGLIVSDGSSVDADGSSFADNALLATPYGSQGPTRRVYGQGINVRFASSCTAVGADVSRCGRNGIQVSTGSTCSARDIIADECGRYGIRATQGGWIDCQGAHACNNGSFGIYSTFGSSISAGSTTCHSNGMRRKWWGYSGRGNYGALVGSQIECCYSRTGRAFDGASAITSEDFRVDRGGIISCHHSENAVNGHALRYLNGTESRDATNKTMSGGIIFA